MPYQPRSREEIYTRFRDRVLDRTDQLTHLPDPEDGTGVNFAILWSMAGYFRLYEHGLLAAQLSGWVQYAGGPTNEEDLLQLNLDPERINLSVLNNYQHDGNLDALGRQNGVTRDPGGRAIGEVTFLTVDQTVTVPAGTRVATDTSEFSNRGGGDDQLAFRTTADATPDSDANSTRARAPAEAERIGAQHNVGPGQITTLLSVPSGVRGVTNQTAITGGEPPETNDELRERIENAIIERSGGGTAGGVTGGIVSMIENVDEDNVAIEEFHDPPSDRAPYADVIVAGGDDDEVEDAIETLRPLAIDVNLVRPTRNPVSVDATVTGGPVDIDRVETQILQYLSELGIGEDVYRDRIITAAMTADDDIENIETLTTTSERTGEYSGDLSVDTDEKATAGAVTVDSQLG